MLPRLLLLVTAGLLAVAAIPGPAAAHSFSGMLPVEYELLLDEGEDAYFVVDGYDLYDLFVREAHVEGHGDGLVFRFSLWGGFQPGASPAETLSVRLGIETPAGPAALGAATQDVNGATWTSDDAVILRSDATPDLTGNNVQMELFATYEALGAAPGETISGAWMESYVDDRLIDIAPGGLMVGDVEVPTESVRVTDEVTLQGPIGYTETIGGQAGTDTVNVTVRNLFAEQGQHIHLMVPNGTDWTVSFQGPAMYPIDGNQSATFVLRIDRMGASPLPIEVMSDLGGRETLYLGRDAGRWVVGPDVPLEPDEVLVDEAPGVGLVGLLVLVGLIGHVDRRRRA